MYRGINTKSVLSIVKSHLDEIVVNGGYLEEIEKQIAQIIDDNGLTNEIDSIKEIADWINGHQGQYNELLELSKEHVSNDTFNETIEGIQGDITNLSELLTSLEETHGEDIQEVQNQIETLEGKHVEDMTGVQGEIKNLNEILSNVKDEIKTLGETHVKDMTGVQGNLETLKSETESEFENIKSYINGVQSNLNNRLSDFITLHTTEVKNITDKHDAEIAKLDNDLTKKISDIETKLISLINGVQSELSDLKSKPLVIGKDINKQTSKFDATFGGFGVKYV